MLFAMEVDSKKGLLFSCCFIVFLALTILAQPPNRRFRCLSPRVSVRRPSPNRLPTTCASPALSSVRLSSSPLFCCSSPDPELTPSSFIPGARIEKYLGRVNLHLIKERMSVRISYLITFFLFLCLIYYGSSTRIRRKRLAQ